MNKDVADLGTSLFIENANNSLLWDTARLHYLQSFGLTLSGISSSNAVAIWCRTLRL